MLALLAAELLDGVKLPAGFAGAVTLVAVAAGALLVMLATHYVIAPFVMAAYLDGERDKQAPTLVGRRGRSDRP